MELEDVTEQLLVAETYPELTTSWKDHITERRTAIASAFGTLVYYAATLPHLSDQASFAAGSGMLAGMGFEQERQQADHQTRSTGIGGMVFQRPKLVGLASGIGFGAYALSKFIDIMPLAEALHRAGWLGLAGGSAAYGLSHLASIIFHPDSLRSWASGFPGFRSPAYREGLLEMPQSSELRARLHASIGQDVDNGSEHYVASLQLLSTDIGRGPSHHALSTAVQGLKRHPDPVQSADFIRNGTIETILGHYQEAERHFHDAIRVAPVKRVPHIAHARFLQYMATLYPDQAAHSEDKARRELEVYAGLLARDETVEWRRVGECRNEVLIAQPHEDLASGMIPKRSDDRASLREEEKLTRFMHKRFGFTSNPVLYIDGEEADQLLLETAPGRQVLELVREGKHSPRLFIDGARQLAQMHSVTVEELAKEELHPTFPAQDPTYYAGRVASLFVGNIDAPPDVATAISERAAVMDDTIHEYWWRLYIDDNLRNGLHEWYTTRIDLEQLRWLPLHIDLINWADFHLDYLGNDRKKVINAYKDEMGTLRGERLTKAEREDFDDQYVIVGAQRHLELVGYRIRDASDPDDAIRVDNERAQRYHYKRALDHLEQAAAIDGGDVQSRFTLFRESLLEVDSFFTAEVYPPTYPRGFKHRVVSPLADMAYTAAGIGGLVSIYLGLEQFNQISR